MTNATAIQESEMNQDAFPTRNGGPERIMDRTDPIVWGHSRDCVYLDDYERESFEEKGFLIKRNLFSDEEIEALTAAAEELRSAPPGSFDGDAIREPEGNALRTLFRLEKHSDLFNTVIRSERIAGVARSILDDEVYIYQTRLNNKPGFQGNGFYWHSDFETWHAEDGMPHMRALSASILLTDNDGLNGPLMVMPGSHKTFVGCAGDTPDNNFEHSLQRQDVGVPSEDALSDMAERFGIEAATGKAGTVIFFDCNLMHGSNGNITPFARSNAFFVYNARSNQLNKPYSARNPRPDFLASHDTKTALVTLDGSLVG